MGARLVDWLAGRWQPLALLAALAAGIAAYPARAQSPFGDAAAKARFTVTIARFVHWPSAASGGMPLRLCVMHGSAALAAAFGMHDGTLVGGRPLAVVSNPVVRTHGCDLLFIDGSAPRDALAVLKDVAGEPTLTLGAVDGFVSRGGMVELVNVDDSLRFDVNLVPLRSAGLTLSSQVLKLAREVRE